MKKTNRVFYFLLALAMVGWGASWVNAKILSGYIDEYEMVFLRFFLTAITMIPIIAYLRESFKIDKKTLALSVITSVAFILYMKYFFLGTKYGTASLGGAFVTSLAPIITFVMLAFLKIKKITRVDTYALILGALGVMTMLGVWRFDAAEIFLIQNFYFVLAATLWPIVTILSSKSTSLSPIVFTFYLYIVTVLLDAILFIDFSHLRDVLINADTKFWINIASIVLLGSTYANTIYFLGVQKIGAGEVSSFIFIVPSAAIGLSILFLDEHITMGILIGLVLSLIAIKILNRTKKEIDDTKHQK